MPEFLAKLAQWGKNGAKAVAAGKTEAELGLQSPDLPTAMVRLGRAAYVSSLSWIILSWYTGYCNERTKEGEWKFLIPGNGRPVINPPDRPNKAPFGRSGNGKRKGGIEGFVEGGEEGLEDTNPFGLAMKIAKAAGVSDSGEGTQTRSLEAVPPAKVGSMKL